jgi:DNA-directed RNA polymerase subunit omega
MSIVIREILEDKIYLDNSGNMQISKNPTVMANIPGAYPGMPGSAPPIAGSARQATDE